MWDEKKKTYWSIFTYGNFQFSGQFPFFFKKSNFQKWKTIYFSKNNFSEPFLISERGFQFLSPKTQKTILLTV